MIKRVFGIAAALISIAYAVAQELPDRKEHYSGVMGKDTRIEMELETRGKNLSGDYHYVKFGKLIYLTGKWSKDGSFTLTEKDENGKVSGKFNGKLGAEKLTLQGKWTSANGKRTLPFTVKSIAVYKILHTKSKQLESTTNYPQFRASSPAFKSMNKLIADTAVIRNKGFIQEMEKAFKEDPEFKPINPLFGSNNYSIEYYSNTLVSILITDYQYTGGAHGNTYFDALNYSLANGKAKPLWYGDLFKKGSGYHQFLSDYCLADLKRQKADYALDGSIKSFKPEEISVFTISSQGIDIYFPPYAVGPYAQGIFIVHIPLS